MRIILTVAALAAALATAIPSAEAAKRRTASPKSSSTAVANGGASASAFDADPSSANGRYPDWARRAFASKGGPGK
jgi:hypothetical protein